MKPTRPPACFDHPQSAGYIQNLCEEHRVDITLIKDLCGLIHKSSGAERKSRIDDDIAQCIQRFLERNPSL